MMKNKKVLFITNLHDLESTIPGGVQICSQYFLEILKKKYEVEVYPVKISSSLNLRIRRKLRIDGYDLYKPEVYIQDLIRKIAIEGITTVFLNKSELIRFSKPLKLQFRDKLKIVVLSHGNETGDFLHDIVLNKVGKTPLSRPVEIFRLGLNLYVESYFRRHYVDMVCSMSETEAHIEKWISAKKTFVIPQVVSSDSPVKWSGIPGKVGFVGTLNHTPNYEALKSILEELKKMKEHNVVVEVVGGPESIGRDLELDYPHCKYLGRLADSDLHVAMTSWSLFLNPIFWYSRGASMKLSKAIAYEIPIITTEAGRRGYYWEEGDIPTTANNATEFVKQMLNYCLDRQKCEALQTEVLKVKRSSPDAKTIAERLEKNLGDL